MEKTHFFEEKTHFFKNEFFSKKFFLYLFFLPIPCTGFVRTKKGVPLLNTLDITWPLILVKFKNFTFTLIPNICLLKYGYIQKFIRNIPSQTMDLHVIMLIIPMGFSSFGLIFRLCYPVHVYGYQCNPLAIVVAWGCTMSFRFLQAHLKKTGNFFHLKKNAITQPKMVKSAQNQSLPTCLSKIYFHSKFQLIWSSNGRENPK